MFNLQTHQSTCPGCGSECEAVKFSSGSDSRVLYMCTGCADAETASRKALERRERCLAIAADITPAEFKTRIDPSRINPGILPALELDGTEGAGLIGKSESGKTRVAYRLLKKAAFSGLTTYAVTCARFRQAASGRHDPDGVNAEIIRSARFAQFLLLDDVGKGARTEVADEALFSLLDERRAHKRATVWTANGSGEWIAKQYGADKGTPIAVRLAHLAGCFSPGTGRIFKST